MEKINVNYSYSGAVAQILFNAPKANIIDAQMMQDLQQVFAQFRTQKDLKLITFEGAGDHFSFGASVEEHTKDRAADMLKNFHRLFFALMDLSIPTLAKVRGLCLGGGCELALMCNMIFALDSAKFGQPEISLAVFPPPASIMLPLKIGQARADTLLLSGRNFTAAEAAKFGLVNGTFTSNAEMETATTEYFEKHLQPKSAMALRFAVKAMRANFNHILRQQLAALEKLYLEGLMQTHDANEGIAAFMEKRQPDWRNE